VSDEWSTETRLDLAAAYREMGLLDDAAAELERVLAEEPRNTLALRALERLRIERSLRR